MRRSPLRAWLYATGLAACVLAACAAPHGALPSPRQLAWHAQPFYAFVHFGVNTFTDREWGAGDEDEAVFAPSAIDFHQWIRAFKAAGMSGVIVTAKHHDGFCLWDSALTTHDTAASSYAGDLLADLAAACCEEGFRLGVYLSPWDRNQPLYGRDDAAYNDYFARQLEEVLTGYGPIFEVWWDGANGDRNDPDKHQEYDWARFIAIVRAHQPKAVIFSDTGPDVRWIGNEHGEAGATQWCTMRARPMGPGDPDGNGPTTEQLNRGEEGGEVWMPGEVDVSIRKGWFFSDDGSTKSAAELWRIWHESVGRNANLLLNVPPDRRGLIHEADVAALAQLGEALRATYGIDFDPGKDRAFGKPRSWEPRGRGTGGVLTVELGAPARFDRVLLQERIELGQRVRAFRIEVHAAGAWREVFAGTTIGARRIAVLPAPVRADAVRVVIDDSSAEPALARLGLFLAPPPGKEDLTLPPQ